MAQKSTNSHRAYIPVWWQYCLQWWLRRICSQSIIGRKSSPPHRTRETAGAATKQNQLYSPSTWILPKYFNPTSKLAPSSNLITIISTNIRSYDSLRKAAKSVLLDADNRNQGAGQLVQLFNKPGFPTLPSTWQTKVLDQGWPIYRLSSLLELTSVVRDLISNWVPCTLILTVVHLWAVLQTLWSSLSSDLQPLTPLSQQSTQTQALPIIASWIPAHCLQTVHGGQAFKRSRHLSDERRRDSGDVRASPRTAVSFPEWLERPQTVGESLQARYYGSSLRLTNQQNE